MALIAAILVGWLLGRDTSPSSANNAGGNQVQPPAAPQADSQDGLNQDTEVQSLVRFSLPDGWSQQACQGRADRLYFLPPGQSLDCAANPSGQISLAVDPQNTTSCQQLDGQLEVRKHVCKSEDINGQRSLESETEFLPSSSYGRQTTIKRYFVDTGDGVVEARYQYNGEATYSAGFEQLAKSLAAK